MNARFGALQRPIRTVLQWQVAVTAAFALAGAAYAGAAGALSGALGGAISIIAGGVAAVVASKGSTRSAGGVLIRALAAEGVKVGLIVLLLWGILATFDGIVMPAFFGAFFVTILIFSMAFFVREYD